MLREKTNVPEKQLSTFLEVFIYLRLTLTHKLSSLHYAPSLCIPPILDTITCSIHKKL